MIAAEESSSTTGPDQLPANLPLAEVARLCGITYRSCRRAAESNGSRCASSALTTPSAGPRSCGSSPATRSSRPSMSGTSADRPEAGQLVTEEMVIRADAAHVEQVERRAGADYADFLASKQLRSPSYRGHDHDSSTFRRTAGAGRGRLDKYTHRLEASRRDVERLDRTDGPPPTCSPRRRGRAAGHADLRAAQRVVSAAGAER